MRELYFSVFFSHISDEKGGWEKNGHAQHSENTPEGDLGEQTKVSLTTGILHIEHDDNRQRPTKVNASSVLRVTLL